MDRMYNAIMLTIFIQLALYAFAGANYTSNSMYTIWENPNGSANAVEAMLVILGLLSVGAVALFIGSSFFTVKTDLLVFGGVTLALVGFSIPIYNLWNFIASQSFLCATAGEFGTGCNTSKLFASIIAGTLAVYYLFVCMDFWRGKD